MVSLPTDPASIRGAQPGALVAPRPVETERPDPLRRRFLRFAETGMYRSGMAAAFASLTRARGATILCYHSVTRGPVPWIDPSNSVAADLFEDQVRYLARHRHVTSMTQLAATLAGGNSPERGTVVITFDDGYLDTLEVAAPILQRHGLPATVYLPTGCVTRGESPWIDDLYTSFCFRTRHDLNIPEAGLPHVDAASPAGAEWAYARLRGRLIQTDPITRARILGTVAGQLAPSQRVPRLTMNWDEVRALRQRFPAIEIGAHSIDHVDLCGCDPGEARRQIEGSLADLARELGPPAGAVHFSCPYSRTSAAVQDLVRAAGYASATGGSHRVLLRKGADPFSLDRINCPRSVSSLAMRTSGAYPALPRLIFGRATS